MMVCVSLIIFCRLCVSLKKFSSLKLIMMLSSRETLINIFIKISTQNPQLSFFVKKSVQLKFQKSIKGYFVTTCLLYLNPIQFLSLSLSISFIQPKSFPTNPLLHNETETGLQLKPPSRNSNNSIV